MSEYLDRLALEYPCAYCLAPAGEWCTTVSGHFTHYLHAARQDPIRRAYVEGYSRGYADCQAFTTQKLESIQ